MLAQQIKDKIIEKAKKTGWKCIIERHKKLFVEMSENEVVEIAKRYRKKMMSSKFSHNFFSRTLT